MFGFEQRFARGGRLGRGGRRVIESERVPRAEQPALEIAGVVDRAVNHLLAQSQVQRIVRITGN